MTTFFTITKKTKDRDLNNDTAKYISTQYTNSKLFTAVSGGKGEGPWSYVLEKHKLNVKN